MGKLKHTGATEIQYHMLGDLFYHYNEELFNGLLSDCMISINNHIKHTSFFKTLNWRNTVNETDPLIHEITLNPKLLGTDDINWHMELVHLMVHLWQHENGNPTRNGYHNRQWAKKMEEIGLMPSSNGMCGGNKTGQEISQYSIPKGLFIESYNNCQEKLIKYVTNVFSDETTSKWKSQIKFTCTCCGDNAWGKPGLKLLCKKCYVDFKPVENDDPPFQRS